MLNPVNDVLGLSKVFENDVGRMARFIACDGFNSEHLLCLEKSHPITIKWIL